MLAVIVLVKFIIIIISKAGKWNSRTSHMLGKVSTTEPHPGQLKLVFMSFLTRRLASLS
jgi:hypothetical protein